MDQYTQQWATWLSSIPSDQQQVLYGLLKPMMNGSSKAPAGDTTKIKVTRTPTEDLYITKAPKYLDILNLHPIYQQIGFGSNLLLKGPKGDGKTLSVLAFAANTQTPIVIQECSEDTKKYDLMGSQSLVGTETVYVLGSLPTAIDVANETGRCILLLEELNALTPQVQKQLNAITDFRKMVSMPHIGRSYQLREGAFIWVVGTMNPSVYGGTYDLNEDLKSRFEEIDVTYPEAGDEKRIIKEVCAQTLDEKLLDNLIRFAKESRTQATGYSLSTRDLVRLVETVAKLGLPVALQMVICKFEGEDRDTMLKRMQSVFGPQNTKKYWGAIA